MAKTINVSDRTRNLQLIAVNRFKSWRLQKRCL